MVRKRPSGRPAGGFGETRRAYLAAVGTACTFGLAGCVGGDDDDVAEEEDPIRIGVAIPETDGRTSEGEMLLDGYELAVEHINAGSGPITEAPWGDIEPGGLLGEELELVVEDTGGSENGAVQAVGSLVEADVAMITGGTSREEGLGVQSAAAEEQHVYMGGFVPTNDVGGQACSRYGFHEMYNPQIAAESLANLLADQLGADRAIDFTQLYSDTTFGDEFSRTFQNRLQAIGPEWFGPVRNSTRTGRRSYTGPLEEILAGGPDLVILNHYGLDAVNAIRDFADLASEDVTLVVPIMGPEIASGAGSALDGVYGTVHWLSGLPGAFSSAFENAWDDQRSTGYPSQFAHLAYVQLCQWAAAVERAGTTDADAVIDELEGHEYDIGTGTHRMRACDHQAMRYAPVVRGRPPQQQSPGTWYEIVASIPDGATDPPYECTGMPAAVCDL